MRDEALHALTQNLKEYNYEGYTVHVAEFGGLYIDMYIFYRFIYHIEVSERKKAYEKIKKMMEGAKKNFIRYFANAVKDQMQEQYITAHFSNQPPFLGEPKSIKIKLALGLQNPLAKVPWEKFKKILDKLFFIIKTMIENIAEMPEIDKINLVNRNNPLRDPEKKSPWVPAEKWSGYLEEAVLENANPKMSELELKEQKQDLEYIKIAEQKFHDYRFTYEGNEYKIQKVELLKEIKYYYLEMKIHYIGQLPRTKPDIEEEAEAIIEKANKNLKRFSDHHGVIIHTRKTFELGFGGSADAKSDPIIGQMRTYVFPNFEEYGSVEAWWKIYKKVLDKFFFILNTIMKEINEVLAKKGLPQTDTTLEPEYIYRNITESEEYLPYSPIDQIKEVNDKLENYRYIYDGNAYHLNFSKQPSDSFWFWLNTRIANDLEGFTKLPFMTKIYNSLKKASKNFERFAEHHGIHTEHSEQNTFGVTLAPFGDADVVHGALSAVIDRDNFKEKTVETWWRNFKKVLDKFFFNYFTILEEIHKLVKEYNGVLVPIKPRTF